MKPAVAVSRLAGILLAGVWFACACSRAPSQSTPGLHGPTSIELILAADPDRQGPPAWTWVRATALRRLPGWPSDLDPFAAIRLHTTIPDGTIGAEPVTEELAAESGYLRATAWTDRRPWLVARCNHDGSEVWYLSDHGDSAPSRLVELAALSRVLPDSGPIRIHVAAAVGNLMAAAIHGDPLSEALTHGASQCGQLDVSAWNLPDQPSTIRVRGSSAGGLTLPAILATLADRQRHDANGRPLGTRQPSDLERWLLQAASTEFADREEAVRQLGRFADDRAYRTLLGFLNDSDTLAEIAMLSLAQIGRSDATVRILATVDRRPSLAAVGRHCISSLWRQMPAERRDSLRELLTASAVHAPGTSAWLATIFSAPAQPRAARARPGGSSAATVATVLLALALAVAACVALSRRSKARRRMQAALSSQQS